MEILQEAGFSNIQVARLQTDGERADTVLLQFPQVSPNSITSLRALYRNQIVLIAGEPHPLVPDLRGWRTDDAVRYLESLRIRSRVANGPADNTTVVVVQEPGPGPIDPRMPVALSVRPAPPGEPEYITEVDTVSIEHVDTMLITEVDTLFITEVDTVYVPEVDTVYVPEVDTIYVDLGQDSVMLDTRALARDTVYLERADTVEVEVPVDDGGGGGLSPLAAAGLAALAGLGLGGLGGAALLRKPRPPLPAGPAKARAASGAEGPPDPDGWHVGEVDPVVIDEAVWVTHGSVGTREGPP